MVRFLENNSGFNSWSARQDASTKKSNFTGFIWWVVIFLLAWWLFSSWLGPKKATAPADSESSNPAVESIQPSVAPINFTTDNLNFVIHGPRISQVQLNDFEQNVKGDEKVKLLGSDNEFAEIGMLATGTNAPDAATVWKTHSGSPLVMTWRNSDGVDFTRTIAVKNYVISITDEIKNNGARDFSISPYARIVQKPGVNIAGVATGGVAFENDGVTRESWKNVGKKSYAWTTPAGFVGFEEQYWQTIASSDAADQTIKIKPLADGRLQAETSAAAIAVPAGKTITITTNLFAGPKTPETLKAAATSIHGIEQTIDYGWFWFLSRPFLWALNALYSLVANYGIAIILLTIIIRILMWPLTRKSFTGMAAMQKMQPEMQRIQKLYANDKVRMQTEMMRLYKESKTSPMSGCLPMLLQIPIFFALYKALLIAAQMRHAGFLWIHDLSVMDPYFILPILMGATMWFQQKLQTANTNSAANPNDPMAQTQKMMKWMPLLFTALFAWMPAGLVLYWTVSNIFGIGQMWWIKRNSK